MREEIIKIFRYCTRSEWREGWDPIDMSWFMFTQAALTLKQIEYRLWTVQPKCRNVYQELWSISQCESAKIPFYLNNDVFEKNASRSKVGFHNYSIGRTVFSGADFSPFLTENLFSVLKLGVVSGNTYTMVISFGYGGIAENAFYNVALNSLATKCISGMPPYLKLFRMGRTINLPNDLL